jgi:hypothetical protein
MTRALTIMLTLGALAGCVLPDYKIYDDRISGATSTEADAGAVDAGAPMFPGAEGQCAECLASQCGEARMECGSQCDGLQLPVSPAMTLPDEADPLMKCMVDQCDDVCNIRWGCVGKYDWPEPSKPYTVTLSITDPLTNQGIADVKATACEGVDPGCAIGGGMSASGTTDADGRVSLQVSSGFYGYFLIDAGSSYYPVVAQFSQPSYRISPNFTINVFQRSWVKVMASMLQAEVDNSAGQMIFRAQNCLPLHFIGSNVVNAEAADVSVSYGRKGAKTTKVFYTIGGLGVDPEATETSEQGSGFGGALNLPAGQTSIVGRHDNTDVINATIPLRADALGILFLVPNAQD